MMYSFSKLLHQCSKRQQFTSVGCPIRNHALKSTHKLYITVLVMALCLFTMALVAEIVNVSSFHRGRNFFARSSVLQLQQHRREVDEHEGWNREFASREFLGQYWQKKPLLIRGALGVDDIPVESIDLQALSLEDDVESRVIRLSGDENTGRRLQTKEYGPFESLEAFEELQDGGAPWTIFVQEIDRHMPSMMNLWENFFNFIPCWRRDDVMVSYATKDAGIGAHVDDYDVFLIQARGTREWSIENDYVSPEEETFRLLEGEDTKILKNFEPHQTWILEPGDMLYIPPRIPHRGVALDDDCVTVSMGFRAPSMRSALTAFVDHVSRHEVGEKELHRDPEEDLQKPHESLGLISLGSRRSIQANIREKLLSVLDNNEKFDRWIGSYLTTPLRMSIAGPTPFFLADQQLPPDADTGDELEQELPIAVSRDEYRVASERIFASTEHLLTEFLGGRVKLRRAEGTRFAHTDTSLFVDGEVYDLSGEDASDDQGQNLRWGPVLCDHRELSSEVVAPLLKKSGAFTRLLSSLVRSGYYYPVDCVYEC